MFDRRIAGAALLVLMGGLTACTEEDPQPRVAPSSSAAPTSPTASATASPTESAEPTAEPQTGEQVVRRWFELHNELSATGESREFRRLSSACTECLDIAGLYEDIYDEGGSVDGGVITVLSTKLLDRRGAEETWIAQLRATPTRYREAAGTPLQTVRGGRAAYRLVLRNDEDLTVTEIFQESL